MKTKSLLAVLLSLGLMVAATSWLRAEEKDKEEDEVKMKIDDVPAPVKAELLKESGNAKIDTVDKENEDGKAIYEADAVIDGKNYEIKVAEDGSLISKKLDDEAAEKGGKDKD